jgi:hypothetical protein
MGLGVRGQYPWSGCAVSQAPVVGVIGHVCVNYVRWVGGRQLDLTNTRYILGSLGDSLCKICIRVRMWVNSRRILRESLSWICQSNHCVEALHYICGDG